MSEQIKYATIDINGLSSALAEEAWKAETRLIPEQDLYETVMTESPPYKVERQYRPQWATVFFNIKELYLQLIYMHTIGEVEKRQQAINEVIGTGKCIEDDEQS